METNEILNRFAITVPKDSTLFREGELSTHIYFIKSGKILLQKKLNGVDKIVGIMGQGDFFGELAFLENSHRISTAKALEESVLLKLEPKLVISLGSHNSEFMQNILRAMAKRLVSYSNFLVDNITLGDLEFKVISRIIQYIHVHFTIDKYIVINKQELIQFLSEQLSVSEEKITLVLDRIEEKKLLIFEGESINILDVHLLLSYTN